MQIAIITGEASGDRVGAQLAQEIRRLRPDAALWGTGGAHLRAAGVELLVDSSRWGVIGVASGLRLIPRILRAWRRLQRELRERQPDVVVPIDAGAFNLGFFGLGGLCPWVRRNLPQTRILYYFPPGSWRRTLNRTPLAPITDAVATPFPWNETELRRFGVNAHFVGHPLLDLAQPTQDPKAFADQYGLDLLHPTVGIFPGSRAQEIRQILPVQLAAASLIHRRINGVQFLIGLAPTVDRDEVIRLVRKEQEAHREHSARFPQPEQTRSDDSGTARPIPIPVGGQDPVSEGELARRRKEWLERAADMPQTQGDLPVALVEGATYDAMTASDVLLITSGTATLEAAILGKPMIITYRLSRNNFLEYLLVRRSIPRFIGMPNLLADRLICPEYIQDAATPEALSDAVIDLLLEPDRMLRMRDDLRDAVSLLGEPGGAARTAKMVVELAEQGKR